MLTLGLASLVFLSGLTSAAPTEQDWNFLNQSVSGRLTVGIPFARPCFEQVAEDVAGTFSQATCEQDILPHYIDHYALTEQLGGYNQAQWQECQAQSNGSCFLDFFNTSNSEAFMPPRTCNQGSVPPYGIQIQSVEDVFQGYNFSRTFSIPLSIKNTGHDWQGRSSGPGTLALWTHFLKEIERHDAFRPTGCGDDEEPVAAVSLGAGVQAHELIDFADTENLTVPTGGDQTVGIAGGYLLGGGHSILTPSFGLAVDRVLEIEIVTPSGEHLVTNRCQNSDLFFALRGAGAGTFGVVLKVTTRTYPKMNFFNAEAFYNGTVDWIGHRITEFITDQAVQWAENGWGYYAEASHKPDSRIHLVNPLLDHEVANRSLDTLRDLVLKELGGNWTTSIESSYKNTYEKYTSKQVVPSGTNLPCGSRLIPKANFETKDGRRDLVESVDYLRRNTWKSIMYAVTPSNFTARDPELTSVTPAWRNSIWHLAFGTPYPWNATVEEKADLYRFIGNASQHLIDISPGSGTYQNEAHLYQENFAEHYFGANNYPKLLEIKEKYDPEHILDCWQCVGWEGPSSSSKYKCYIDLEN